MEVAVVWEGDSLTDHELDKKGWHFLSWAWLFEADYLFWNNNDEKTFHLCDFDNGAFTVETQELERLNFESNRSTGTKEFQWILLEFSRILRILENSFWNKFRIMEF